MKNLKINLKKQEKKLKIIKKLFILFLILTSVFTSLSFRAYASNDSDYYSYLSDEELSKIFELKVKDIPDPWGWISDAQTYVIIEKSKDSNDVTYWWNVPNIQMTFQNMLYDVISISGYGSGSGKPAYQHKWLVDIPEEPKTAMEKWGFNIPSPTYMGERPLIVLDVMEVLIPDGFLDTIGRICKFIFKGKVFEAPTNKDMDSLIYASPRDYDVSGLSFQRWIENNWYKAINETDLAKTNKDSEGNTCHAQILVSNADGQGMLDGVQWTAENIIWREGLAEPNLSAEYINEQLKQICGKYYADVCKNIILSSGLKNTSKIERIMPYDILRLNSKDAKMFNGVTDPRSSKQENLLSTGYLNIFRNKFQSAALSVSGKIAELSVALNSVANFSFLEKIGLNPVMLWSNNVVQLLVFLALSVFAFFVVKSAISVVSGNYSGIKLITKVFGAFLVVLMVWSFGSNPQNTYENIKAVSSNVFNLGNVAFESNEKIQSLYGTGSASDKESVNIWLPYFNMWTLYQTNYGIMDSQQEINLDSNLPEIKNLESSGGLPEIDGIKQNLWSTILADAFTTKENYSGNIYRVVDHFMAPRISKVKLEDGSIKNINVKQNENYFGKPIQSNINIMNIPMQILILFLIIMKVLLFFEFIFNIALLIFSLCLSTSDNLKLLLIIKELGASMLNVMFINICANLVIYLTLMLDGLAALLVCIFLIFIIINLIKSLARSNSIFTPKFFRQAEKIFYWGSRMFEYKG